jgi:hypothetical protein
MVPLSLSVTLALFFFSGHPASLTVSMVDCLNLPFLLFLPDPVFYQCSCAAIVFDVFHATFLGS